jgi:hypothetical protein
MQLLYSVWHWEGVSRIERRDAWDVAVRAVMVIRVEIICIVAVC